jgi:CRISPR-associated protein Cas1
LAELASALFAPELAEELAREDLRLVRTPSGLRILARAGRAAVGAEGTADGSAGGVAAVATATAAEAAPERQRLFEEESGLAQLAKRPLYLTDPLAQVRVDGELLVVELEEERRELPIRGLSHLVCLGRTRLTLPALWSLAELGVPAYFCTPQGQLKATFGPHAPDWRLWNAQAAFAGNAESCLAVARELVSAKLHNAGLLASRFELGESAAKALHAASREVVSRQGFDEVLGTEGYGARLFFEALAAALPAEWGFTGRKRQPPPDPVNSMLSFGYTLLHHHASTVLQEAGLNPRIGIFHRGEDRYDALAADLQEEMRWLVDALAIGLVRRREVKPVDFEASQGGVWLRWEFRKRFVAAFEERLLTEVAVGEEKRCYREILCLQAKKLAEVVLGKMAKYAPFRLRY